MMLNHSQLKEILAQKQWAPVLFLWGSEPALLLAWKSALLERLEKDGAQIERLEADGLDVERLCENAQMIAFFGSLRTLAVEDLEPEGLNDAECRMLCDLISSPPPDTLLLFFCRADSFDEKKGARAKKLAAAAAKQGKVVRLDRLSLSDLKLFARSRCEKQGCRLSDADAAMLVQRCNGELGVLSGECDKLCAYASPGNAITAGMIEALCLGDRAGDLYGLARLMLRGQTADALLDIDRLLLAKEPSARVLGSLGIAFSDLYKAVCARKAKKTARELFRELGFRFEWQAERAFRDSSSVDEARLFAVCKIFCDADLTLKSGVVDERALIDTAILRTSAALKGEPL